MRKRVFAAALLAQLMTSTAWAQGGQDPVPATPVADQETAADDAGESNDIFVTAQRRQERLQDVPIAVTTVAPMQLENQGVRNLEELNAIVPGLNIINTVGTLLTSIRGISTSSNVVENPVALYIDGVYLPNQREGLRDLADIEQITVLRGPQGTLFGRNATAGVIQITTRAPSQTPGAEFTASIDNYETFRTSAYLTGGIADDLAASLSLSYQTQGEGWGRSLSRGFEVYRVDHSFSARAKLLWTPGDTTRITLIGDYLDRSDSGQNYQPYPGTTFAQPGFGPVTNRYDTYAGTPGLNAFKGGGVSLQINQELGFADLVSISSYRDGEGRFVFDFTNVPQPFVISRGTVPAENYTQELQLISPSGGALQWVLGAYYFHSDLSYVNFTRTVETPSFPSLPGVRQVVSNTTETSESFAPFAQIDYQILPGTKLTLGARWTYERREIRGSNQVRLLSNAVINQPAVTPSTQTIEEPSWRVALDHRLSDDVLIYASWNRGIKSGGYNIGGPNLAAYLPETLDAFEVGLKSQFFDRRLTLNIAPFYYSYTNLQVASFLQNATSAVVTNGAEAELYGVDVDFRAVITDSFTLSGGFEYLHSEFKEFPRAPISTPLPTGGATIVPGDARGNRLPLAQEFVGTVNADYTQTFGRVKVNFNVNGTYSSDYYLESDNIVRQPSYFLLGAALRLSDPEDRTSLTFSVTNILDEGVITRAITTNYSYFVAYTFPPRLYTLTARFRF